jgi:hypothetical protein
MAKEPKKKSTLGKIAKLGTRVTLSATAVGVLGVWGWDAKFRDVIGNFTRNAPDVGLVASPEDAKAQAAALKEAIIPSTYVYTARERLKLEDNNTITQFLKGKVDDFEVLDSYSGKGILGSLQTIALRQKSTNRIFVSCAGFEVEKPCEWVSDFRTGLRSTAGGVPIADLDDLKHFVDHVQKDYGRVDVVCGHSFGGLMACAIKPYLGKDVVLLTLDSPGIDYAIRDTLADYYKMAPQAVEDCFKHNTASLVVGHNAYNRLGRQPGKSFTLTPPEQEAGKILNPWFPEVLKTHSIRIFDKDYDKVEARIVPDSPDGVSTGPAFYSAVALMVLMLANFNGFKKGVKKMGDLASAPYDVQNKYWVELVTTALDRPDESVHRGV